jgi:5-methyltetrahydrofolate--homocysteine methyltransferase
VNRELKQRGEYSVKAGTILEFAREQVVLLDGGMGTMLIERGLKPGQVPELWNLDHPEIVLDVHSEYVKAGSAAILTNTFGASSLKLKDAGLAAKAGEVNRTGAEIARKACLQGYVIGDVGPTGKILLPYGDLKEEELQESLEEQIASLLEGQVDALAFETQMDLREALFGVKVARSLSSLPIIVSFTFNKTKRGYFTLMGNSVEEALRGALAAGADIVGANCSLDSGEMKDLTVEIRRHTSGPVYAKPNAGKAELVDGKVSYAQPVDSFMKSIPDFFEHGVRLIGGCCGTNPAYISAIKQLLKESGSIAPGAAL